VIKPSEFRRRSFQLQTLHQWLLALQAQPYPTEFITGVGGGCQFESDHGWCGMLIAVLARIGEGSPEPIRRRPKSSFGFKSLEASYAESVL
jgi:hypothetical protein